MKILIFLSLTLMVVVGFYAITLYTKIQTSKQLVSQASAFSNLTDDYSTTLLVLGDSTGVGVGAITPTDTVAGLWAKHIDATYVENYSVSGDTIEDLSNQIAQAQQGTYDYILIQIGANDIIRFHDIKKDREILTSALQSLPNSTNLMVMSAGNLGSTTFFPWFMKSIYTKRTLSYHSMFTSVVPNHNGVYTNLYDRPENDLFMNLPELYYSADGLHPSSAGYNIWFEKLRANDQH